MTAFAETLDKKWSAANLPKVQTLHTPTANLPKGQLTGHKQANFKKGESHEITQMLYLDDGAFPFNTREDATKHLNHDSTGV